MISYEITRKGKPQSVVQSIKQRILASRNNNVPALLDAERIANQLKLAEGEKPDPLPPRFTRPTDQAAWVPQAQRNVHGSWEETAISWGKIRYNKWLSGLVMDRFPKGTLVALRTEPFIIGMAPRQYWEVIDHQEVYYMANMDREVREPKCVGLWNPIVDTKNRIPTYYPPAKLRVLQPEEVKEVDKLRNQKGQDEESNDSANGKIDVHPPERARAAGEDSPPEEGNI